MASSMEAASSKRPLFFKPVTYTRALRPRASRASCRHSPVSSGSSRILNNALMRNRSREGMQDITYQVEHRVEPVDLIAIRFHHRLVSIHPFPNGNGRHARLMADVLIEQLGAPRFSWGGSSSLVNASALRQQYIAALQRADRGDLTALLAFARES